MRGIIFQPELVGVLLERGRIVTRRVMKEQPRHFYDSWIGYECYCPGDGCLADMDRFPYGAAGGRLYIKEPWRFGQAPGDEPKQGIAMYTDFSGKYHPDLAPERHNWARLWQPKSPRFMPQWASRATVEIVRVWAAPLGDMTEADAIASGVIQDSPTRYGVGDLTGWPTACEAYAYLWDKINEDRGYPFDPELWVWVLDLKLVQEAS